MTRLSLSLLGPLRIASTGTPLISFESDKVRALLFYLATEADCAHRREALAGLLWPNQGERLARHSLSQALFNLRRAIADHSTVPPFLLITRETVQFNSASDHWVDTAAFNVLLVACDNHRHRHLHTCVACARRLTEAVALYRGSFLQEFSLADSAAFEEWAQLKRERLHWRAIEALAHLTIFHERRGEYDQARRHAGRQIELDPWREEAHRLLMQLLLRCGQRSAALAQYNVCRRVLADELGVEPEEETVALYEHIRASTTEQRQTGT